MARHVMQVASISLRVRHEKRAEAISAIDALMRRTRSWPGCLGCRLMTEADDTSSLMLLSEWQTRYDLESFLTSREFLILKGMRILLR
jgi:quinol monooxygenase YgiN